MEFQYIPSAAGDWFVAAKGAISRKAQCIIHLERHGEVLLVGILNELILRERRRGMKCLDVTYEAGDRLLVGEHATDDRSPRYECIYYYCHTVKLKVNRAEISLGVMKS